MARYQLTATLAGSTWVTADIVRLTLVAPAVSQAAAPGQFVMVRSVAALDPLLRRPFSVSRVNHDHTLELLVKVIGKGTRCLAALNEGDQLDLLGPLGHGFTLPDQGIVCLVGGGIGAAPLLFLAQRLSERLPAAAIQVLLGARNAVEATAMAAPFIALNLPVKLATDDGTVGHHGLVGDLLTALPGGGAPTQVFACGPHPMLAAVARISKEKGWPCQVSTEAIMACGLGACLGCAVPKADGKGFLHVCKQGPVFAAGDLQW